MGGALLKCGSLKEMRRVSNASDLESTPATAALASNFAAWGCFATACCLLLAACCCFAAAWSLLLFSYWFSYNRSFGDWPSIFDSPRVPYSGLPWETLIDFIVLEKSIETSLSWWKQRVPWPVARVFAGKRVSTTGRQCCIIKPKPKPKPATGLLSPPLHRIFRNAIYSARCMNEVHHDAWSKSAHAKLDKL